MKGISRILPILLLFSFTLYAQGVNPNCEKGDAIFRDLWFFFSNVGHSAIYLNSDSKFAEKGQPDNYNKTDPRTAPLLNSDLKHSVIQANGTSPQDQNKMLPLTARTFEGFLNGQRYWGAFNGVPGGLTYEQRKKVVYYAWLQIGCDYVFLRWPAIKLPSLYRDDGKRVFIGSFRCDGLVEYVYESINIHDERGDNPNDWGFFTEEEEKHLISTFYPRALADRMYEEQGKEFPVYSPPQIKEITLKDSEGNPIEPDEEGVYQVSGKITIEANISDGDYGSGVDRMVVLVEDDAGDTFYLNGEEYVEGNTQIPEESLDDHDEDVEGTYTLAWDTDIKDEQNNPLFPPGYYTLHVLAYDQAGNVKEETIEVVKKGDNLWKVYRKFDVHEDYDTYVPTPEDFGEYWKEWEDSYILIPKDTSNGSLGGNWVILGFRTYVYVSEPLDLDIGIIGDDGVALYVNGEFVCGRGNAEDPMAYGVMHLLPGWNKIEALVYDGPDVCWLEFDKKIGDYVEIIDPERRE